MRFPSKETVAGLRCHFPKGCEVELVRMDDPHAPPVGTRGTVMFVDDIGTIHVAWHNGSCLGIAFGEDRCRRI